MQREREKGTLEWIVIIGLVVLIILALPKTNKDNKTSNNNVWSKPLTTGRSKNIASEFRAKFRRNDNNEYKYKLEKSLLSPAERSFYGVLKQAINNDYELFTKVRIADIINPVATRNRKDWFRAFNKISAKHVDFVLCDKENLSIKAAIELNDKSHNKPSRKKRDLLVSNAMESANLPLITFTAKSQYKVTDIREKINLTLS